jgi:hypothetical protein
MPSIGMSIDGVTHAGDDIFVFPVYGFSWGGDLKRISVTRDVTDISAQIVLMQVVDDARNATISCTDDDGTQYLTYAMSSIRIRDYSVIAGPDRAREQFTAECQTVVMTSGEYTATIA